MNVSLTAELEKFVSRKVETGLYQTASEVVREGLRILKERDEHLESLRRDVRAGLEDVQRGDSTDLDEGGARDLAERIKSRGRRRLDSEKRTSNAR